MADESLSNGICDESTDMSENMKLSEKRALVEEMLTSETFREELKEMVVEQMLMASTKPLTELLTLRQRFSTADFCLPGDESISPVCDIRGVDSLNYSKGEKLFRCKLASFYRTIDLFSWANVSQCYVTAKSDTDFYMVIPDGIWFDEVTASSLVKVGVDGQVLDAGSTGLGIDEVSFSLHSKFHDLRNDIGCVVELTCPPALSLSVMKCGLLPLCPEAIAIDEITYLDFSDLLSIEEELTKVKVNHNSKVLVLRNYGIFVIGETIEEAFYLISNLMSAIETQLTLIPVGLDNLHVPLPEFCHNVMESAAGGVPGRSMWRRGELEFEAMMRQLDGAGYCTGYVYHDTVNHASGTSRQHRAASDAGLVHSSVSLKAFGGSNHELARFGSPHKVPRGARPDYAYTPNVYHKEESDSRATPNAKITKIYGITDELKWLSESAPARSPTPSKMEKVNQFAPQGINPLELKEKVKAIRQDYYSDRVSAGPQSRILDGITWDEAKFGKDGHVSGTSDNLVTMTASKGIIQREHQRHAVGFKKFDAPNPFNRMSEEEIETYKQQVERRTMTSSVERLAREDSIEPAPDGRLISTEERLKNVRDHGEVGKQDANGQKET